MRTVSKPLQDALAAIDAYPGSELGNHRAMARGLMRGYDARWHDQEWLAQSIEQEFELPVYNLETKGRSRTFTVAGKIDINAERHGKPWIFDHKTTSSDIHDADGVYWRQLGVENQADLYLLTRHLLGVQVEGAIWDVIRKPGIRPKAVPKKERVAITSVGAQYCGFDVSDQTKRYLAENDRETDELYEYRVARESLDKPERYFQRRSVLRLQHELVAYARDLWDLSKEILHTRQTNRHLRNGGACMAYGSACAFLGICSGYDNPDSDKWVRRGCVHEELETLTGDGRDVLTNSRLGCYLTCKRKHYYRYELGIERRDSKQNEALYFGSLFHKALEVWWGHYMTGDNNATTTNGNEAIVDEQRNGAAAF